MGLSVENGLFRRLLVGREGVVAVPAFSGLWRFGDFVERLKANKERILISSGLKTGA